MGVKDNILTIQQEISSLCARIGRKLSEITLLAVIKEAEIAQVKVAIDAGIADIGENKVQEALIKYNRLNTQYACLPTRQAIPNTLKWHMIGHLQTNKVKDAVKIFDLIHSVDSLHLTQELDKQAKKINKVQDILIEVNTSGEKTKFGLKPDETIEVIKKTAEFKNVNIKGLMTIAPIVDNPENTRPYFRMLKELKDKINNLTNEQLTILSMGMSHDYKVAIEEGATIVRIGSAIFK